MTELGFISAIRGVLLREDDAGIATNNTSGGRVTGVGVSNPDITSPAQGEPGGPRRRRHKTRMDRRLHRAIEKGGVVELMDYFTPVGRARFYSEQLSEGNNARIDDHPELPSHRDELPTHRDKVLKARRKKLKLKDGSVIELEPSLPTRYEAVIDEGRGVSRPTQKCDYLCKIGLAGDDLKHLTWYRTALKDPDVCINNATMRPVVANVLNHILDYVFDDAVLYNRLRLLLLQNREREQFESVDPNERFRRWAASTTYYQERDE
jgi:hypothetical protein